MIVNCDDLSNLYVTDGGNHFIRKIEPSGQVTTMSSEPGKPARYMYPLEITRDHKGNFYFADSANSIIRMDAAGKFSSIGRYMNASGGKAPSPGNLLR